MAEHEILRPCRRAYRIGLHEAKRVQRALQGGRREEAARHRSASQVVKS